MEQIFADVTLDREFRQKGYVIVPLLSAAQVEELTARFTAAKRDLSADFFATAAITDLSYRQQVDAEIKPIIVPLLQNLLVNYRCSQTHYVVKPPGRLNGKVPVHQDYSFTDANLHTAVHVWTPLVDVDDTNGCLKVMPGSHTFFNHICAIDQPNPYDQFLDVIESDFMISQPMKAGQALLYDGRLLHASNNNNSTNLRIATNCIMLPVGSKPRLYKRQAETPSVLTHIEMTDEVFLNFDIKVGIPEPYPASVTVLEPFPYQVGSVTIEQMKDHMEQYLQKNRYSQIFDTLRRAVQKIIVDPLGSSKR